LNLRPLGYERWVLDVCGHPAAAVERRLRRSTARSVAERPDASRIFHAEVVDQRLTSPGNASGAVGHDRSIAAAMSDTFCASRSVPGIRRKPWCS